MQLLLANTPNPHLVSTKHIISVYQRSEARMQEGNVQPAPGINGSVARGEPSACMHMNGHYCHNQLKRSTGFDTFVARACQTKRQMSTKHVVIPSLFILSSRQNAKPDQFCIDFVWVPHLIYQSKTPGKHASIHQSKSLSAYSPISFTKTLVTDLLLDASHSLLSNFVLVCHFEITFLLT